MPARAAWALVEGIVLVVLVLLVFIGGFRPSLVVALSLPFSVMFAFIAMKQFGLSANLMSLGGLVTSTALTLLVIPAVYRWFAEKPKGIEI